MTFCGKCRFQSEDSFTFCPNCGNRLGEEDPDTIREDAFPQPIEEEKGKKRTITLLLWILFPMVMLILTFAKSNRLEKKEKTAWISITAVMMVVFVFLIIPKPAKSDVLIPTNAVSGLSSSSGIDSAPKSVDAVKQTETKGANVTNTDNGTDQTTATVNNAEPNSALPSETPSQGVLTIEPAEKGAAVSMEVGDTKLVSFYLTPISATAEDIKTASTNKNVAEAAFSELREEGGQKVLKLSVTAKSAGETTVVVESAKGSGAVGEIKISVKQKPQPTVENTNTVYVTPTGKRYHFSAQCAGQNAAATTLDEAKGAGLTPCGKCAK